MANATLYSINQTDKRDELVVKKIVTPTLAETYTSYTIIEVNGQQQLLGYDSSTGKTDSYLLTDKKPYLKKTTNKLDFKSKTPWDHIEAFYVANKPYIFCYQSKNGHMYFYPISDDLESGDPLHFYHTRYPYTTGLTEVKMLVSQGQVFVFGYNGSNGYVNSWTVSATARSVGNKPPLVVDNIWAHQWAKGWTRFSFFTWGNENFFLKTNTWKLNVNIDHLSNVLSAGSNEVGSHLESELINAAKLTICRPFVMGPEEPYFLTYLDKTGESIFNRFHANCLGWSKCATLSAPKNVSHIVPYRIEGKNYVLYI